MKLRVDLYGTLREEFPGFDPSQGMQVEIPDGATAKDLLAALGASPSRGALIIAKGRTLGLDSPIEEGAPVSVFQSIHGG
jgi:sulfur carrier protein ThiS